MSVRSTFTHITAIPPEIVRETVMETLRSHAEMIDLNPLVVDRYKCEPPAFAGAEEFSHTWYTIKDKISYLPGGLATSEVEYHACFRDITDGLQTHVYAPLGLEIRGKWSVGYSRLEEPKNPDELALGLPEVGLYLREDVDMKCNVFMTFFVKRTLKKSHATLVDRLVEKANSKRTAAAQKYPASLIAGYRY